MPDGVVQIYLPIAGRLDAVRTRVSPEHTFDKPLIMGCSGANVFWMVSLIVSEEQPCADVATTE